MKRIDVTDEESQEKMKASMIQLMSVLIEHDEPQKAVDLAQFLGTLYAQCATVFITQMLRKHPADCLEECEYLGRVLKTLKEFLIEPFKTIEVSVQQNMLMYDLRLPNWEPVCKADEKVVAQTIKVRDIMRRGKEMKMSLQDVLNLIKEEVGEAEVVEVHGFKVPFNRPPDSELN